MSSSTSGYAHRDGNHAFYKGLIQFAGGFVHLQKQYEHPHHPKDGTRVRPAVRLFQLAARNLAPYRPAHLRLDVEHVWTLSTTLAAEIARTGYANPWTPESAPTLSPRAVRAVQRNSAPNISNLTVC